MHPYKTKTTFSRTLRRTQTEAEKLLWLRLRDRRLGAKFRRQQQIGAYIVDFVSFEAMVIIEADGSQHATDEGKLYDKKRTEYLQSLGYNVLRFWDNEVLKDIHGVLARIHLTLTLSSKERG